MTYLNVYRVSVANHHNRDTPAHQIDHQAIAMVSVFDENQGMGIVY